jgi:hypothetical protein
MGGWARHSVLIAVLATAAPCGICAQIRGPITPVRLSIKPAYPIAPLAASTIRSPRGWGLIATVHGRSADLMDPSRWTASAMTEQDSVGLSWRGNRFSTTFGYSQTEFDAPMDARGFRRAPGLLGVSVALHTR